MAIADVDKHPKKAVTVKIINFKELYGSAEEVAATVPLHPQKPEMGSRVMRRSEFLLLEQEDCAILADGEEITLLRWGNFFVSSIVKDEHGAVVSMEVRHDPDAQNFSKTKKFTWLAVSKDNVSCHLFEFGHLITKAKLGEDDDFKDFVNPNTKSEVT